MLYDAINNEHGLAHDPFKAIVAPRPIGWIGSVSETGVFNLAPYSFFNAVADRPHYVMFSSKNLKDSIVNIEATGEFTCSLSTFDTRMNMNLSSAPVDAAADEFALSGLTTAESQFVKPPRVNEAPAALECRHWKTIDLPDADRNAGTGHFIIVGHVVGVYIDDTFIEDGLLNTGAMQPLARMGYMQYSVVRPDTVLDINRPQVNDDGSIASELPEAWNGQYR